MEFEVKSARLLSEVALLLEKHFSQVITYEDIYYRNPDDLTKDEEGRIVPRGGRLFVRISSGDDIVETLNKAVKTYNASGFPGKFKVEETGKYLHILPLGHEQLLDTIVSLPSRSRNGLELLEDMASALREKTGIAVTLGTTPMNVLIQHLNKHEFLNRISREIIIELFEEIGHTWSWQLLNIPGEAAFILNIHKLPK